MKKFFGLLVAGFAIGVATSGSAALTYPDGYMRLEGQGVVYTCVGEESNPNITCVQVQGARYAILETFDRAPNTKVTVQFDVRKSIEIDRILIVDKISIKREVVDLPMTKTK